MGDDYFGFGGQGKVTDTRILLANSEREQQMQGDADDIGKVHGVLSPHSGNSYIPMLSLRTLYAKPKPLAGWEGW